MKIEKKALLLVSVLFCSYLNLGQEMLASNTISNNEIYGTWSTYVPDDKPYGTAVTTYDFSKNGTFRMVIIPVPKEATQKGKQVDTSVAASEPIQSFIIDGKFRLENNKFFLITNLNEVQKEQVWNFEITENLLILSMEAPDKATLVLRKSQNH